MKRTWIEMYGATRAAEMKLKRRRGLEWKKRQTSFESSRGIRPTLTEDELDDLSMRAIGKSISHGGYLAERGGINGNSRRQAERLRRKRINEVLARYGRKENPQGNLQDL